MKLRATQYTSPEPKEGTFDNVFIEEKSFTIEKERKYMSIVFEMYYFRDDVKVELDTRTIAFYGMQGDSVTSNKLAVLSVPNENYDAEVEAVPLTVQATNPDYQPEFIVEPNPDYDTEVEGSEEFINVANPLYDINIPEFITIDNPDYDQQVEDVPEMVSVPLLQYLYAHEGVMPEVYEVTDWGFPSYEDVLQYFEGGDRSNLDISITNPFARGWLLNTLVMKNEKVGVQFQFVD